MPLPIGRRKYYYVWEIARLYGVSREQVGNLIRADVFRGVLEISPSRCARTFAYLVPAAEVYRVYRKRYA